jgi:SagB-type dehydrogenase family enzyme
MSLGEALRRRRSIRDYAPRPLPLPALGRLLHASYGVRGHRKMAGDTEPTADRTAPSAGGRYPLELYVAAQSVEGLGDGVYHYDALAHELELRREGTAQPAIAELALGQAIAREANVVIAVAAARERTMWKYGQRGYRFLFLDAGHVGQNVYLAATAMGLAPTAIGGFLDAELNALLALPDDEEAIYLLCVGQPAEGEPGAEVAR